MNIRSAETGHLKNSGYFARMARRVVLSSALLALVPSGGASLYLRPGIQMEINNHGQEIIIGEGSKAIQFNSTTRLDPHLDKLGKMYDLITELNTPILSWPVRKVTISDDNSGEYKIENNDHLLIAKLRTDYLETTAHEMGHAIFLVKLGGQISPRSEVDYSFAIKDRLWQKIYYLSLGKEGFMLVSDSNYHQDKSVIKCQKNGNDVTMEAKNVGHPWDNADELFASSVMTYRLHADELLETILDPGISAEKKRLGVAIWVYLRDKIFNGKYFSINDPFKGISIKDINIADEELHSVLRLLLKKDGMSCDNAFYYPLAVYYGPEVYFIGPALRENRNWIIEELVSFLKDEDPDVRKKMVSIINFLAENAPQFPGEIFEPLLQNLAIGDPVKEVRDSAKYALHWNKKWGVKYLIIDLNNPDPKVREFAAWTIKLAIELHGIDAITAGKYMPYLIRLETNDPDEKVRLVAATTLEELRRALKH
ncbi:MAG: hypothetical protein WC624_01645 [Candidatus Margulisiibacteriota bacterium]